MKSIKAVPMKNQKSNLDTLTNLFLQNPMISYPAQEELSWFPTTGELHKEQACSSTLISSAPTLRDSSAHWIHYMLKQNRVGTFFKFQGYCGIVKILWARLKM